MPSHPERVRRNYHTIKLSVEEEVKTNHQVIQIRISRLEWVTAMSKREIMHNIYRSIRNGIMEKYRD